MKTDRLIGVEAVRGAPLRFFERVAYYPELPWVAVLDLMSAMNVPKSRFEGMVRGLQQDLGPAIRTIATDGEFVVVAAEPAVKALRQIVSHFNFVNPRWSDEYLAAARAALLSQASRVPLDQTEAYMEAAHINTWGAYLQAVES